jgi:hypothetical protein
MSAAKFIRQMEAVPAHGRERVSATPTENPECREDILDLITVAERKSEPTRPVDDVLKNLKIKA